MTRYAILWSLALFLFISCSQDDSGIDVLPGKNPEMVSATFRLSMDQGLDIGTGYEPMKAAVEGIDDGRKIMITNSYMVYIVKEVGTKWIIDKIMEVKIDPDDEHYLKKHIVKDGAPFHSFETDLRPGNYRMTVITGFRSLNWNEVLKEGTIVEDSADPTIKAPWVCTYKPVGTGGYIFEGWRNLAEEVFTNTIPFKIEKTQDLHSAVKPYEFPVSMHRMVGKIRILLKYEATQMGNNFYPDEPNAIAADLKTSEQRPFCAGLDIWGQPYYDNPLYGKPGEGKYITNLKYIVSCWQTPNAPVRADNGSDYILGMWDGARQFSPFYFTDPKKDNLPVALSRVEVTGSSNFPLKFVYAHPEAHSSEDPVNIILRHNAITGIVLKPGDAEWPDPTDPNGTKQCMDMILETDGDGDPVEARTIFDDFFEYRIRQHD